MHWSAGLTEAGALRRRPRVRQRADHHRRTVARDGQWATAGRSTRPEPILAAFAKRVVYVGAAGSGQAMKLAVNLVVFTLNSAVSEALTLATSAGVRPEAGYDIFQDSVIAAPFVNYKRAGIPRRDDAGRDEPGPHAQGHRPDPGFAAAQGVPRR